MVAVTEKMKMKPVKITENKIKNNFALLRSFLKNTVFSR